MTATANGPRARDEGRYADRPTRIPGRGWRAVGGRVLREVKEDHLALLAAGVAFKALLALFPAIVAAISIWGLVVSPEQVVQQVQGFTSALPSEAASLLEAQMTDVAGSGSRALSVALTLSVLLALWAASGGVAGLVEGCNAAYDEVDERSLLRRRGRALLMTLGAVVFLMVTLGLLTVLPAVIDRLGLGSTGTVLVRVGQWVALAVLGAISLGIVYRFGPDRDRPRIRWVSVGAVVATVLWLAGSAAFTLYVENFGTFGETYGAFAGIIILMLWLLLSAFVVLLGAEINAEAERQTTADTTEGEPRPPGAREATVADTTVEEYEAARRGRRRPGGP